MSTPRPIPEGVKREVRKRCYFGCIICGCPLFEYDHLEEFSVVQAHDAANIFLLCSPHHQDKTSGRLSKATIQEWTNAPFNSNRENTGTHRLAAGKNLSVMLGSNTSTCKLSEGQDWYNILWINGKNYCVAHIDDGALTVSMLLTNREGKRIFQVHKGEIQVATDVWDYTYIGTKVTVRAAHREIILEMTLKDDLACIHRGTFIDPHGDGAVITPDGTLTLIKNGQTGQSSFVGCHERGNLYGGWAVLNPVHFPAGRGPKGVGFLRG